MKKAIIAGAALAAVILLIGCKSEIQSSGFPTYDKWWTTDTESGGVK